MPAGIEAIGVRLRNSGGRRICRHGRECHEQIDMWRRRDAVRGGVAMRLEGRKAMNRPGCRAGAAKKPGNSAISWPSLAMHNGNHRAHDPSGAGIHGTDEANPDWIGLI